MQTQRKYLRCVCVYPTAALARFVFHVYKMYVG